MQSSIARLACLVLLVTGADAYGQSSFDDPQAAPDTRVRGYWVDPSTGLMWAGKDNFGRDVSWRQADKYCRDLRLAGHADWRLPETNELEGIYDGAANAQGLGGPRNQTATNWKVKGDLFLTGYAWSASGFIDARGRFRPWGLYFDFGDGTRNQESPGSGYFRRALCVRGEVLVDLSTPARYTGVDLAARNAGYLEARMQCEIAVFTRVPWRGPERACRRLVDLADHLAGDPVLERVNALGMLAVGLVSDAQLTDTGRLTESLTLLDRALAMRRQRYEDDPAAADLEVIRKRFPDLKPAFSVFQGCVRTSLRCDA